MGKVALLDEYILAIDTAIEYVIARVIKYVRGTGHIFLYPIMMIRLQITGIITDPKGLLRSLETNMASGHGATGR